MKPPRYHFDRWGRCLGYMDEQGRYFDKRGRLRGKLRADASLYDENGIYLGRFDVQGQYWDEHGHRRGYLQQPVQRSA